MIPFDLSGSVHLAVKGHSNAAAVKAIANRLEGMLYEKDVSEVFVEGSRVRFRNAWFGKTIRFGFSSDDFRSTFLTECGSGTFDIDAGLDGVRVHFSLSLARVWASFLLFAVVLLAFHSIPAPSWDALWPFPLAPIATFFVIYWAVTWLRVRLWLSRGLKDVSDTAMKV